MVVSNGVNNLVKIKLKGIHPTWNLLNLHIETANMRSIRNKSTILHDYLIDQRLDAFLVTETWLKNIDSDVALAKAMILNTGNYHF